LEGTAVAEITSPRVDAASKLLPHAVSPVTGERFAKAEGLTVDEALELVAWLKDAGYASIDLTQGAEHCSVSWSK
jgi:hypothetical protein